ncbi:MAG: hypothetical protein QXL19_09475 [Ignisphaera sp.]
MESGFNQMMKVICILVSGVCCALEDKDFINVLTGYGVEFRKRSCVEVNGVLGIQKFLVIN